MVRLINLSGEVMEGRDSVRVEEERTKQSGWIVNNWRRYTLRRVNFDTVPIAVVGTHAVKSAIEMDKYNTMSMIKKRES